MRRSHRLAHRPGAVALVMLLVTVCAASGQQVRGKVTDAATGRPVRGALITALDRQDSVLSTMVTDSAGRFSARPGRNGPVRLRVERLGYERLDSAPVPLFESDTTRLELRLTPSPIRLPGLAARATRAQSNLAGFLRRRQVRKFGAFMGPEEIAAIRPSSGDHLLSLFVGVGRDPLGPGILAGAGYAIIPGLHGPTSGAIPPARARTCHPWVYIDGRPMESWRVGYGREVMAEPTSADFYIPVQSIRGVEVYRSWYDAPAQYIRGTGRDCAIILLWTDYGFGFREKPPAGSHPAH